MTDELKPVKCGCGGEAKVDWTVINGAYMAGVVCQKCGMKTASVWRMDDLDGVKAEAIRAWNRAMGAKDINVPNKERTAKVKDLDRRSETSMSWEGICTGCGAYTNHEMNYCFACGCRLIWGEE